MEGKDQKTVKKNTDDSIDSVTNNEKTNEEKRRLKDRSPSPDVKSTAVVKYTAFQSPVEYSRLQCNTDLNLPPSKWGPALDSYGLKQILTRGSGLSSFRMANMFPDCVGNVDVIAGAESIKNLLKLPYQPNGIISIMVHQVEDTLLLDDFNVYDYLMKSEWSWLKDFFYKNVVKTMAEQEHMKLMVAPAPSSALQHKFLSHSVATIPQKLPHLPANAPMCLPGPSLPEPEVNEEIDDEPSSEHLYNRNVLWTFENIHMLIGTDLPIFGDNDRPCVSLRLRDVRDPINVLTGIDLWLDNLMCNVPEVLMCYHLDGIVQKYEQMKTEDLPTMKDSKFSPKVINNVAQNILSFLKSNVTKAGHTYWLFKGPKDDVVKLYDLTPLCPDSMDNPFTIPVAMLLYRVARNMRMTNRSRHVKELLQHALELLPLETYPQLVASSHYMLADLYVPATTDPAKPNFKDESSESEDEEESEGAGGSGGGAEGALVAARGLALRDIGLRVRDTTDDKKRREKKKLETDPEKRCILALEHALQGLRALHYVTLEKSQEEERERIRSQIIIEEQHPKMANPNEPIKMNYEPIAHTNTEERVSTRSRRRKRNKSERKEKKDKEKEKVEISESEVKGVDRNAILIREQKQAIHKLQEPHRDDNFAWKLHLKTLLYEKICLVMATLAEINYKNGEYGLSLKHIMLASKCQKLLSNMIIKSEVVDASCLIGRVGDNYFQIFKHWSNLVELKKQYETELEYDVGLRIEIERDMAEEDCNDASDYDLEIVFPCSGTGAMEAACEQYGRALRVAARARRRELLRRLGSVRNELAVNYMNRAKALYDKYIDEPNNSEAKGYLKQYMALSKSSWACLEEASKVFAEVDDLTNLALLYCNKGRYMRFRAHCHKSSGFGWERRKLFTQGEELYLQALQALAEPEGGGGGGTERERERLRELVSWELSSHMYTLAVNMQDHPINYANEMTDVAEAFKNALKYCPLSPGPRAYMYQFRAAMIHHKLASLYHKQYREVKEDGAKMRQVLSLSRGGYERAAGMFAAVEDAPMYLTTLAEHVALLDVHAQVSPNLRLKSLQTSLQLLRQSHSIIKLIKEKDSEDTKPTPTPEEISGFKSEKNLLNIFEKSLQNILKKIIQYCLCKANKDYHGIVEVHKKLYSASLKIKKNDDIKLYAASICDVLSAMDEISKNYD